MDNFELPSPATSAPQPSQSGKPVPRQALQNEMQPVHQEHQSQGGMAVQPTVQGQQPPQQMRSTAQPTMSMPLQQSLPPVISPSSAHDVDLIEKDWVEKAKQIVDKNRQDPYMQTKQLSQFKADYIKKRYNKDIKTAEEHQ